MLRDASVICIASVDWDYNRQNPQEAASAFATAVDRVLYIENTGARNVRWRDAKRLRRRFASWWKARGRARQAAHHVDVLSPILLPLPYSGAACALNARILLRKIRRWLRERPDGPLIVLTFLPTPLALLVTRALSPDLLVYYCIDRSAASSPGAERLDASEKEMFREADLVLVTSGSLLEFATPFAKRAELIVSGVHVDAYDKAQAARSEPHPAFEGLNGPVVGFVGSIRNSTDIALIAEVASRAPDLNFMLVGPHSTDISALEAQPNIRLTGAVPYTEIPKYVVRFDAGILPYVLNRFTSAIMPVKLKEYLAAGLPIVATPLPEVLAFAREHDGLISFASDADAFVRELRAALDSSPAAAARRMEVARGFTWSRQMMKIVDIVSEMTDRHAAPAEDECTLPAAMRAV